MYKYTVIPNEALLGIGHWIRARGYDVDLHDELALTAVEAIALSCADYEILLDYLFDSEDKVRTNLTAWSDFVASCRLSGIRFNMPRVYDILRRTCIDHGAAGVRDVWRRLVEYVACFGTSRVLEARIALRECWCLAYKPHRKGQPTRPLLHVFSKRRLTAHPRVSPAAKPKRFSMGPMVMHSQRRLTDLKARGLPVSLPDSRRSRRSRSLCVIRDSSELA